jgi:hypothetical protein
MKMTNKSKTFSELTNNKHSCYDDQTEVLTSEGWLYFKDLTDKHMVATLINGDTLMYQKPLSIQSYDFNKKMYCVKSNQIDLMVTPNHRMLTKRHGSKHFRIEKSEDIHGKIVQYKKNVEKYNDFGMQKSSYIEGDFFVITKNDKDGKSIKKYYNLNQFIEMFGIWIAEGCMLRDWGVSFATHKPRVKDALERLCNVENLNIKINKHINKKNDTVKNAWCITDKHLVTYFKTVDVGAIKKSLPEWVWILDQNQCRLLIDGMLLGDGHIVKGSTTYRYDTSSTKLADDFQRLCLHAGYCSNIAIKYKAGHSATIKKGNRKGEKITSTVDSYRMAVIKTQCEPKVNKNRKTNQADSWVKYKGKVYCCNVLGNSSIDKYNNVYDTGGIIYVRRNKYPSWSGN